ncbi:hypothetical protein [Nocardioides koreensis]
MSQHDPTPAGDPARNRRGTRVRTALALGALALAVSACGSSDSDPTPAAASSEEHDTAALDAGAAWLDDQVTDGVVHNDQYDLDDYGLSIDVALALHAVDDQPDTVQAVSDQVAKHVGEYTSPGYGTVTSAGGTAKALVLAQAAGADPTSYGGTDLVAQLEDTVADRGPVEGRLQDALDKKEASATDYANVVGQAYAVTGLDAADSDEAAAATDFLVAQQCEDGWFRLDFTKDTGAADQSCDGDPSSKPDLDATAFAVRALAADDSAEATAAVDAAVAWLGEQQASDGSFGGGGSASTTANSNSTGLAGAVLADAGETAAAEKAATWVFRHQAVDCDRFDAADVGAIAYDDASLTAAAKKGITAKTSDQFRRAGSEALPVLQWLPAGATEGEQVGSC